MSETRIISPDLDFVNELIEGGADTVKQCMQCANCSVACELSPDDSPFPRREMILAQWGQKEELTEDPNIWMCFGCTDCSIQCPRGARPGDVMAVARKEAIRRFSPLGFIQKWLSHPKYLPVLVAIPIVIWGLVYLLFGDASGTESYFDGIFPPGILEPVLGAMTMLGSLIFAVGAWRYWKTLLAKHPAPAGANLIGSVIGGIKDVLTHKRFYSCESGNTRAIGHMLMLFGFLLILTGGTIVGMGFMFHVLSLPLDFFNPFKIMLNVGAVMLIVGSWMLIQYRMTRPERQMKGTWYDWFFMVALFGTAVTGLLTEALRYLDLKAVAFGVYFIHLVFVFNLLGYAPWSKLAHLCYRTVALIHARYTGRPTV